MAINWKEVRDQALHFGVGCGATAFIALLLSVRFTFMTATLLAVVVVGLGAWSREIWQRMKSGRPWYECGSGCRLDLAFWASGIIVGVLILWLVF